MRLILLYIFLANFTIILFGMPFIPKIVQTDDNHIYIQGSSLIKYNGNNYDTLCSGLNIHTMCIMNDTTLLYVLEDGQVMSINLLNKEIKEMSGSQLFTPNKIISSDGTLLCINKSGNLYEMTSGRWSKRDSNIVYKNIWSFNGGFFYQTESSLVRYTKTGIVPLVSNMKIITADISKNGQCIGVTQGNKLMLSVDTGSTWSYLNMFIDSNITINSICLRDSVILLALNSGEVAIGAIGSQFGYLGLTRSEELEEVSSNAKAILIRGSLGNMFLADKYGISWLINSHPLAFKLNSVAIIDSMRQVVVGKDGYCIKTNNKGLSWFPLNTGTTIDLLKAAPLDDGTVIVTGEMGTFFRIKDSSIVFDDRLGMNNLTALCVHNGKIFVGTPRGELYIGSGNQWSYSYPNGGEFGIFSLWFKNSNVGYIGSDAGVALETNDGGQTWVPFLSRAPNGGMLLNGATIDSAPVFVPYIGSLLKYDSSGWLELDSGHTQYRLIASINDTTYFVGALDGQLEIRTTHGGINKKSIAQGALMDIQYKDNVLIAISSYGEIIYLNEFASMYRSGNSSIKKLEHGFGYICAIGSQGNCRIKYRGNTDWIGIKLPAVGTVNSFKQFPNGSGYVVMNDNLYFSQDLNSGWSKLADSIVLGNLDSTYSGFAIKMVNPFNQSLVRLYNGVQVDTTGINTLNGYRNKILQIDSLKAIVLLGGVRSTIDNGYSWRTSYVINGRNFHITRLNDIILYDTNKIIGIGTEDSLLYISSNIGLDWSLLNQDNPVKVICFDTISKGNCILLDNNKNLWLLTGNNTLQKLCSIAETGQINSILFEDGVLYYGGNNNLLGSITLNLLHNELAKPPNILPMFDCFPIPFRRLVNIRANQEPLQIKIYDIFGRLLFSQYLQKAKVLTVNFQGRPTGTYFVQGIKQNKKTKTRIVQLIK